MSIATSGPRPCSSHCCCSYVPTYPTKPLTHCSLDFNRCTCPLLVLGKYAHCSRCHLLTAALVCGRAGSMCGPCSGGQHSDQLGSENRSFHSARAAGLSRRPRCWASSSRAAASRSGVCCCGVGRCLATAKEGVGSAAATAAAGGAGRPGACSCSRLACVHACSG